MISEIARDIPVSGFFERVIPSYPNLCTLKIACSGLLNAQIARTVIWISSWKLYFSSAAAAWLGSRRARHGALAGRRIAGASFGTLTGRRRGKLVGGAGTILPCCWCRSCWCLQRGRRCQCSLVELISFAQMHPPSPRCRHRSILEKSL